MYILFSSRPGKVETLGLHPCMQATALHAAPDAYRSFFNNLLLCVAMQTVSDLERDR